MRNLFKYPAERTLHSTLKWKRRLSSPGTYILVVCMPKSGSTFMAKVLSEVTGYKYVPLADGFERREQNLYLPKLINAYSIESTTHQHIRATARDIELMNQFSIRPVILVRNIFDIVFSIRDHMCQEGYEFPTFYCNDRFKELDEKDQLDFIIELGIPWFFNFFVSWTEAITTGRIDALLLTYEEVVADWETAIGNVLRFYGIEKTDTEIEMALKRTMNRKKREIRLNKGKIGRGSMGLTPEQNEKIVGFSRFYPWIDFSEIGISTSQIKSASC
jgi:hypothetical protein